MLSVVLQSITFYALLMYVSLTLIGIPIFFHTGLFQFSFSCSNWEINLQSMLGTKTAGPIQCYRCIRANSSGTLGFHKFFNQPFICLSLYIMVNRGNKYDQINKLLSHFHPWKF